MGYFMYIRNQKRIRVQIGIDRNLGSPIRVGPKIAKLRATRPNHPKVELVSLPKLTTVNARLLSKILSKKIRQRSEIKKTL
jgi:hypothetical protein